MRQSPPAGADQTSAEISARALLGGVLMVRRMPNSGTRRARRASASLDYRNVCKFSARMRDMIDAAPSDGAPGIDKVEVKGMAWIRRMQALAVAGLEPHAGDRLPEAPVAVIASGARCRLRHGVPQQSHSPSPAGARRDRHSAPCAIAPCSPSTCQVRRLATRAARRHARRRHRGKREFALRFEPTDRTHSRRASDLEDAKKISR